MASLLELDKKRCQPHSFFTDRPGGRAPSRYPMRNARLTFYNGHFNFYFTKTLTFRSSFIIEKKNPDSLHSPATYWDFESILSCSSTLSFAVLHSILHTVDLDIYLYQLAINSNSNSSMVKSSKHQKSSSASALKHDAPLLLASHDRRTHRRAHRCVGGLIRI